MLFGDSFPEVHPEPERLALLDKMLLDFRTAFPDLHYELRLDRRVVNAQAILLGGKRCVLIYGGLGLHPKLAENSLAFVFLHETGHHLAAGPRLPFNLSLACDCVADHWAVGEGADILRRKSGRRLQIGKALHELECLMSAWDEPQRHRRELASACFNHKWSRRKDVLEKPEARSPNRICQLMEFRQGG